MKVKLVILLLLLITNIHPTNFFHISNTSNNQKRVEVSIEKAFDNVKPWTFMVYMAADNDLEYEAIDDFLEISSIGSTQNINVVVLLDRAEGYDNSYGDWTDTRIFYVEQYEEPYDYNANVTLNETDTGDPNTLFWFINWTISNYPAERYFLVLWDHGSGWQGCCYDYHDNYDCLTLSEIEYVLSRVYNELRVKIDIIGFDACLMSMVDTAFAVGRYAEYMVASEEYEPGTGWPYDDILSFLNSSYDAPSYEIANKTAYYYVLSYATGGQGVVDSNATMSVVNLTSFMKEVPETLSFFSKVALKNFDEYRSILLNASSKAEKFCINCDNPFNYTDLYNFTLLVYNYSLKDNYSTISNAAYALLESLCDSIIVSYVLEGHEYAYGLSAVLDKASPINGYENTPLSKETLWDEFVRALIDHPYSAWLYDAWIVNSSDSDNDGYYESVTIAWDIDTVYDSIDISIQVLGISSNCSEITFDSVSSYEIHGNSTDDTYYSFIMFPYDDLWRIELLIQTPYDSFTYSFVYNVTDDVYKLLGEADRIPPKLEILLPENGTITNINSITLRWSAADPETGIFGFYVSKDKEFLNNIWSFVGLKTSFTFEKLSDGVHYLYVKVVDRAGNEKVSYVSVTIDTSPPKIYVISPEESETSNDTVKLKVIVEDDVGVKLVEVFLNGNLYYKTNKTDFSIQVELLEGSNVIEIKAWDLANNTNSVMKTIKRISAEGKEEVNIWFIIGIIFVSIAFVTVLAILIYRKVKK